MMDEHREEREELDRIAREDEDDAREQDRADSDAAWQEYIRGQVEKMF